MIRKDGTRRRQGILNRSVVVVVGLQKRSRLSRMLRHVVIVVVCCVSSVRRMVAPCLLVWWRLPLTVVPRKASHSLALAIVDKKRRVCERGTLCTPLDTHEAGQRDVWNQVFLLIPSSLSTKKRWCIAVDEVSACFARARPHEREKCHFTALFGRRQIWLCRMPIHCT